MANQRIKTCYMVMQDVNHQLFTESVMDEILLSLDNSDEEKAAHEAESIIEAKYPVITGFLSQSVGIMQK